MPGMAYGEMESPAFFRIKITAQLHSLNSYPEKRASGVLRIGQRELVYACLFATNLLLSSVVG
jgi:hypothetical protein